MMKPGSPIVHWASRTKPDYHRQAVEILRSGNFLRREAMALRSLADTYTLLKQPEKAVEHYTQALAIFRNISDLSYAATSSAVLPVQNNNEVTSRRLTRTSPSRSR